MLRNRGQRNLVELGLAAVIAVCAATGAYASAQRQEASRDVERTLKFAEGQMLRIEHRNGDVRITAQPRADIQIHAAIRVSGPSQAAADTFAERIQVEIVETGMGITVRTRYPDAHRERNLSFSVDYTVSMPERMPLEVRNSFGNTWVTGAKGGAAVVSAQGTLTLADGAGRHRLENSFGAVDVQRVAGDLAVTNSNGAVSVVSVNGNVDLTNRFGLVKANTIRGAAAVSSSNGQVDVNDAASATITNSFGPVTVASIGGDATVRNSNGNVTVRGVKGNATLTGSFGTIVARDVAGATIQNANGPVTLNDVRGPAEIRTTFGLVTADSVGGGLVVQNANGGVRATTVRGAADIRTSFGPVVLRGIEGKVDVRNQNGAIDVSASAKPGTCHDITLTTSFSPIQVQVGDAGYVVTARTSFGRIRSDVPLTVTGTIGEGSLSGTIGQGGCTLQLTNSNGDIQITKSTR
jgi:DUF4097 and DUF4098 domain-containing protein YvlB